MATAALLNILFLTAALAAPDTTFIVADLSLDMTGGGQEEHLVLRAQGDPRDSLEMMFTVSRDSASLHEDTFIVDRVIGFDAARHVASDDEWENVLQFYRDFFSDRKFSTARSFAKERNLDPESPPQGVEITVEHWRELLTSDVPVFQYSPGGDRVYSLAWSPRAERFVDVYPCC